LSARNARKRDDIQTVVILSLPKDLTMDAAEFCAANGVFLQIFIYQYRAAHMCEITI
jgi:peroxiredoxin